MNDYLDVTELSGDDVSSEQVLRCSHRYFWAGHYCKDKDVVEVACGTGPGLGFLLRQAKSLEAGDISEPILNIARKYYGNRLPLKKFDACKMPFTDNSKDVIIIFEAIYYLPDIDKFIDECTRVLRPDGEILIATANKDLPEFNPSPYSHNYYGIIELKEIFQSRNYDTQFYGYLNIRDISIIQRLLGPIKKIIVSLGLMPKTMEGKKMLKKLVFGRLTKLPFEIEPNDMDHNLPKKINSNESNKSYKVIYCIARKDF